jgi:hypothetical protein
MSKTTITGYSAELNQGPPGQPNVYLPLKPNQYQGRLRISEFTLTFASQTTGTSFAVMKLPFGARIISGILAASATLANSATLSVGLAGANGDGYIDEALVTGSGLNTDRSAVTVGTPISDSTTCLKAAAAQGATQVTFAITQALGYLYECQKEVYVTITTGTGTVSTEVVTGHVVWVLD